MLSGKCQSPLSQTSGRVVDSCIASVRAPTADLPTTAGFVGGLVAQEAIKLITRQYVPQVGGYVVIDLIGSWTGIVA